ncbi:flagellinolysin [Litoribacillus peritrichatus]|uniref:Flagellin n=1 Tax=Litoribacillus peritrichatus TaxID=718191 RepID=A0ABP7MH84_9GAMM
MLIINTNIASLRAQRLLDETERGISVVYQRLSSGLRINSAKDNAAGLTMSVRFEAGIREKTQSIKNASDGISLLQTMDGGLESITSDVKRIRDLAIQANNGTLNDIDRLALQAEVYELINNIDQVARNTSFNGIGLLNDNTQLVTAEVDGPKVVSLIDDEDQLAVMQGLTEGWLESSEALIRQYYGLEGNDQNLTIKLATAGDPDSDGAGGTAAFVRALYGATGPAVSGSVELVVDMADFTPPNLPNGGSAPIYNDRIIAHEMVHAVMAVSTNFATINTWFKEGAAEFIHGADERISIDLAAAGSSTALVQQAFTAPGTPEAWGGSSAEYSSATIATRYLHDAIRAAGGNGIIDVMSELETDPSSITMDQAITNVATNLGGLSAYVSGAGFTGGAFTDEATFLAAYRASGADYLDERINLANTDTGSIQGSDVSPANETISAEDAVLDPLAYNSDPLEKWEEDWPSDFIVESSEVPEDASDFEDLAFRHIRIQFGASSNDSIEIPLFGATSEALGISDVDISEDAEGAITLMDSALERLSLTRAFVGAAFSRLESIIDNLMIQREALSSALSRIQDADYAAEAAELARLEVLRQAGLSVLVQANSRPQQVLQLLQ